ncbi:MAG: hypothetical protein FH761_16985 [Firmicutes bacterium]|nr:hypothetical protein [Bacillota bacterium]
MGKRQNPFIPKGKADLFVVDGRAKEIISELERMNTKVISTIRCPKLYDAISYHPDIVMHPISHKKIIVAPEVYEYYKEKLKKYGFEILKGEKKLKEKYPNNIAYNVARIFNYAIHNFKYTDEKLKFYLKKEGIELVNVKQGYTKCSVSIVGEKAIMTSDISIYKTLGKLGIDTLLIEQGYIELPGINYGFIGGSTGLLSDKELLFTGRYDDHPSRNNINNFLKKNQVMANIITSEKIIDLGSIIPLNCN